MASVDSGVETGNDSNDSAQTENQVNNQGLMKTPTITTYMDTPLQMTSTQELNLLNFAPVTLAETQFKAPFQFKIHPLISKRVSDQRKEIRKDYTKENERRRRRRIRIREELSFYSLKNTMSKMRLGVITNNIELMRKYLQDGNSPNNEDEQGRTPLHLASSRGYTEMVQLLLEYGADPNRIDRNGNTPLHLAAATSEGSIVELLLNAGTNVCSSDQHGFSPLQLAQTKLRMLQNCSGSDMNHVKDKVHRIVCMLLKYLQKQKGTCEQIETLTTFCSRISLSNSTNIVKDDVKDLLANIEALSLTN